MDPDMVRQQAEAEREALAALAKKPAGPASASAASIPRVSLADASHGGASAPYKEIAGTAPQAPGAVLVEPLYMQAEPVHRRGGASVAARIGRFVSFGVAGAMLGGGLGIFAVNYLGLARDWTKLAVYGPAALLAVVCAFASFYTKPSHQ